MRKIRKFKASSKLEITFVKVWRWIGNTLQQSESPYSIHKTRADSIEHFKFKKGKLSTIMIDSEINVNL